MNKNFYVLWILTWLIWNTTFAVDVPRGLSSGRSDFKSHVLGDNCYSMDLLGSLPCNPAFLARDPKKNWNAHVFFGNNVQYYKDAKDVLDNRGDTATFQRLFNQTRSSDLEADLELGLRQDHYAFSLSPSKIAYYTLIRDRVLPYISLYASQEQVLRFQEAWKLSNNFCFGIQARGVSRKLILSDFFLTDLVAEGGSDRLLNIRYQNIFYLEPGIVWEIPEINMKPQVSLVITQLGLADKKIDNLPVSPEAELGASIRPEVSNGVLELGTHLSLHSQSQRWTDLFSAAAIYSLGVAQFAISVRENQADLGFSLQLGKFQSGLLYDYQIFQNLIGERDERHTWYFEVGGEI